MPTWLKVILAIIFVFVALFIVGGFLTYRWVRANKGKLMAAGKEMQAEGSAFGQGKDGSQCVDEALRRLHADPGLTGQIKVRIFTQGCLSTASPSPELCAGAPRPSEIIASANWAVQQCKKRNVQEDQACSSIMQEVQRHCDRPSSEPPPPASTDTSGTASTSTVGTTSAGETSK
jgi:hypothetical protein